MNLLLFILVAYGITNILVYSSIFYNMRLFIIDKSKFLGDLIQCMMCTSVWVGFLLSIIIFSPTKNYLNTPIPLSIFIDGMLASGSVWIINSIVEFFEENRLK